MLEVAEHVSPDRVPNTALYHLLLGALRTLDRGDRPARGGRVPVKLLVLEGVQPALDRCLSCGSVEDLVAYDAAASGVRCRRCRAGLALARRQPRHMLQAIAGRLRLVLDEPDSTATRRSEQVAVVAMERFLERRLRAPGVVADAGPARRATATARVGQARQIGPQRWLS